MNRKMLMTRRELLATAAAMTVVSCLPGGLLAKGTPAIPYRTLGKTGERVSLVGLGGYHVGLQEGERESFELYKTSDLFDGTHRNPQWLGPEGEGTSP